MIDELTAVIHVSVYIGPESSMPVWFGDLSAVPAVGDRVWVRSGGERRQFVVIRRDWAMYASSAAVELYVEATS